jgi:acyl transferase domain-containing protein/acyl-CoA synthetase (AMP-forming)/AMP-acid ligase II/acyl carrier protein
MHTFATPSSGSSGQSFEETETLTDSLRVAVERGTGGLVYVRADGVEVRQSYAGLLEDAGRIASGLRDQGVQQGDAVLLQLEAAEDFIPGFWGCVLAGAVAVPVAVAPTFAQSNSALQKLLNAGKLLERAPVLAAGAAVAGLRQLPATLGALSGPVIDLGELRRPKQVRGDLPRRMATDVAVMLLTSGSTGQPKGVPLTHRNLLAMAAGTIEGNGFTPAEVTLNWMALDHVGSVSFLGTMAVALGCTQIHVPTGYILQEPLRWLDLISRHRATISWAPNFAFTLFLERATAVQAGNWDLGSMRFLVNAGEPVVARTARKFIALLQGHGLPVGALRPAFGMSETCSGITWSRGLTLENTSDEVAFVDLGPCNPGAEMRVVNEAGDELPEGETGMLQLRGPSVFSGYFRNHEENAKVFKDGWFESGDLAFLEDGCLRIAGRLKDVIIVNGANFYCHEVEAAAETVPGLIKTFTAACAVRDAASETDQLALFFCLEPGQRDTLEATARAIRAKLMQQVGLAPTYLIALETLEVPKTEIGKIQRGQLKKSFEAGIYRDRLIQLARSSAAKAPRKRAKSRGELSSAIAEIWQDVLSLESVGYDETFFELGGHSLLIVQVQVRLQELMGRPVAVVELFNCPTVRTMAEHFAKDFDLGERATPAAPTSELQAAGGNGDIAIIGIGLRFPGASTPAEFWQVLAEGRETIRFFTAEEALAAGVDPELVRNPNHVRAAPILDAPDAFDADFFRYSAKEARMIDPQQRVFLEVCWEAFEDAGYDPLTFPGKVGLFAAAGMNTYLPNNLWANHTFLQDENGGRMLTVDSMSGFNVMITNDKDYLPMRVSYKLNLRGPSVNVQSACSSTLLTLHEACKSIRMGDCTMALAGGVSIKLPQHAGHLYSPGMLNSPDGHCRAYDEKAEGTIFGNGAGVVLLKPLAAAQAAGDRIYAVVKGTASNNDGGGKVGFTAPSSTGQEDVCSEAMARAGIKAETVTFMEGHGTGTALGDPIEVNALAGAFRRHTGRTGYCALGSVKTNVGHLQIASGIAGLIKTTLALHHRRIPGTLHFEKPNPRIDFSTTPFFVTRNTMEWTSPGSPRRAGVNSLGIGGTNVHAILEEAPMHMPAPVKDPAGGWVLPLSARHPNALRQMASRYADSIAREEDTRLEDLAFTAQVGRAGLPHRAAFVATTREDLVRQLKQFAAGVAAPGERIDFDQRGVAGYFGSDATGVAERARQLWAAEPAFRQAAEMCLASLEEISDAPLARVVDAAALPAGFAPIGGATVVAAPYLFVFQYALAELLASYGIEPTAVGGEGVGEYVAACRSGVFSVTEALRLVLARERLLTGSRSVADEAAFGRVVAQVEFAAPSRRLVSGLSGKWVEAELAKPEHWLQQARADVNGETARNTLLSDGHKVLIDLGGGVTSSAAPDAGAAHRLAAADFTRLLATLFALGYPIQWSTGRKTRPARRVALPTYPWQHQSYWIDAIDLRATARPPMAVATNPLLGRRWRSPRVKTCVYETRFDPATLPCLAEHVVHGNIVTPGALYLSQVALQAADFLLGAAAPSGDRSVRLSEVVFVSAMVIDPLHPRIVQTVFTPEENGTQGFEVLSWTEADPDHVVVHATGRCMVERMGAASLDLARMRGTLRPVTDIAGHYAIMDKMEVRLGPSFRWIGELHRGERQSLLRLEAPAGLESTRDWHPGLVDSFLQAAVSAVGLDGGRTLIPFRVGKVVFHRAPDGGALFAHAQQIVSERAAEANISRSDVRLYDAGGALIAEALGFELRNLQAHDVQTAATSATAPKYFETVWEPLATPSAISRAAAGGAWLFLSEGDAVSRALQRALLAAGEKVQEVPLARATEAEGLLRSQRWAGVVYAWSFTAVAPDVLRWSELLACVKAAAGRNGDTTARWVFLTARGAGALAQSPLGGLVTALAHEHPEWRPLHLEIDPTDTVMDHWVPWLLDTTGSERRLTHRQDGVCGVRLIEKTIPAGAAVVRSDGSYLVTGAAGALGQAVAEWLVAQGARSLCLSGRREPSPELSAKIAAWERRGVRIVFEVAEMGDAESVRRLVARAGASQPLRGVFHAAGGLRDGLLRQAEFAAFTSIFGSKIDGAWELHRATKDLSLDCFVLFSSIASLLGSPGQANYAAANAFMDALALERQSAGLAGLSIQWGPWDGIGMTARLGARDRERLHERGLLAMAPAEALRALEQVLGTSGCVGVFAWNRRTYRTALNGHLPAFYHRILASETPAPSPVVVTVSSANRGYAAMAGTERSSAIERLIRETVATLLGLDSYLNVEREKGLFDLGIDSLTAIDLKDRLEKSLGHALRSTIAFDYPTAAEMAAHLAETLFPTAKAPVGEAAPAKTPPTVAEDEDFARLTASDLEALLEKELKG